MPIPTRRQLLDMEDMVNRFGVDGLLDQIQLVCQLKRNAAKERGLEEATVLWSIRSTIVSCAADQIKSYDR